MYFKNNRDFQVSGALSMFFLHLGVGDQTIHKQRERGRERYMHIYLCVCVMSIYIYIYTNVCMVRPPPKLHIERSCIEFYYLQEHRIRILKR